MVNVALGAQLSDEFVCERMAKKSNFFKVEILMSCSVGLVVPIEVVYPHQGNRSTRNGCRERAFLVIRYIINPNPSGGCVFQTQLLDSYRIDMYGPLYEVVALRNGGATICRSTDVGS